MNVLQLGPSDWSVNYAIPKDVKWEYNAYPDRYKRKNRIATRLLLLLEQPS